MPVLVTHLYRADSALPNGRTACLVHPLDQFRSFTALGSSICIRLESSTYQPQHPQSSSGRMGGCCSSEDSEQPPSARPMNIGRPEDPILRVPRPRIDEHGVPMPIEDHELTRRNIIRALSYVAGFVRSRNQHITLLTVGGVINTVYLKTRQTTHDVDFFGTNLDNEQRQLLDQAAQHAERLCSIPLGGAWLNNETQLHMARDVHKDLTQLALEQRDIVFEEPGLTVLAPPWSYAFVSKCCRLGTQYQRSYDATDAAVYLHEISRRNGDMVVSKRLVQDWCQRYRGEMLSNDVLNQVQKAYRHRYTRSGLTL